MEKIAGIEVHEKVLMVVVVESGSPEGILQQEKFGTGCAELERLRVWLSEAGVAQVIMESTAP